MAEFTVQDYRDAANRAYQEAQRLQSEGKSDEAQKVMGQVNSLIRDGQRLEVELAASATTPESMGLRETVSDVGRAAAAGLPRGAAKGVQGVGDLATFLTNLPTNLALRLMGSEARARAEAPEKTLDQMLNEMTSGATAYSGKSRAGEAAGNIAEFIGSSAAMPIGGPLRTAAASIPAAIGSEVAGQVAREYSPESENMARLLGAVATPLAQTAAGPLARRAILGPEARMTQAGSERARSVGILEEAGVPMSTGVATGSPRLMALESFTETPLETKAGLTKAVMRMMGSSDNLMTQGALSKVKKTLGSVFDDAEAIIDDVPTATLALQADDAVSAHLGTSSGGTIPDYLVSVRDQIANAAASKTPLTGKQVADIREKLRQVMDAAETNLDFNTAMKMNNIVDDFIESAIAAKSPDFLPALKDAREKYRTFLTVKKAINRAGSDFRGGYISPEALANAVRGREGDAFILGAGTPLANLAYAAEEVVRSMPTVKAGGMRAVEGAGAALGAAAGGALGAPLGLLGIGTGAALGATVPLAARAAIKSGPVQRALMPPDYLTQRMLQNLAAPAGGILNIGR